MVPLRDQVGLMNTPDILGAHHGQITTRITYGNNTTYIYKQAVDGDGDERYEARCAGIAREAMVLEHLEGHGIAPRLIDVGHDWSIQEDLGDTDLPDGETFRRACTRLLYGIRQSGMFHGDLTEANVVVRGERAWAVDWQDASWVYDEPPLQQNPQTDGHFLWRYVAATPGAGETQADIPRVVRRWQNVRSRMPANAYTLLDLGCFQGDFVAIAAAEGMNAYGWDQGGFRSGEDSIAIADALWPDMAHFHKANVIDWGNEWVTYTGDDPDVILLFSTWPYLLQDCAFGGPGPLSRQQGWEFIRKTAERCQVLFFETQLAGDGPGPPWLETDGDVWRMLTRRAGLKAEPICNIPVAGRPASRTVWRVTT